MTNDEALSVFQSSCSLFYFALSQYATNIAGLHDVWNWYYGSKLFGTGRLE